MPGTVSTLPATAAIEELVATVKLRWRIERNFEELKQELGLARVCGLWAHSMAR